MERLELSRIAPHAPQTCASTSSATSPINLSNHYFFSGEAAGEAFGSSGLAAPAVGEADALDAGEADALAAGEADAAGEVAAAGADAVGEGVGVAVSTGSPTTELPPVTPGKEKINANSIKMIAATMVAFSKGFCAPRGPKAVWLPAPPKAAATSPPFPDCNKITRIRKMQAKA